MDNSNKAYKNGGWTEKGIDRFKELTGTIIPALRRTTMGVEGDLREVYVWKAQESSGKRKPKEVSNRKVVEAIYESTDEEESDEYKEDDDGFQERGSCKDHDDY
jgi:hypothetical protein